MKTEKTENWTVVLIEGEFERQFPAIAAMDLNRSDKVRLALGLQPRKASAGAPKGNSNAVGNKGRWQNLSKNQAF